MAGADGEAPTGLEAVAPLTLRCAVALLMGECDAVVVEKRVVCAEVEPSPGMERVTAGLGVRDGTFGVRVPSSPGEEVPLGLPMPPLPALSLGGDEGVPEAEALAVRVAEAGTWMSRPPPKRLSEGDTASVSGP